MHLKLRKKHLRAVAVVGEQVGATVQGASDTVSNTESLKTVGDSSRGREVLESLEVDSETSDVGSGHGGTRERSSGGVAANVRGQDTDTGGEDVDAGSVVGEGGGAERAVGRSNGEGVGGVGGGLAGDGERVAVLVSVAGGDDGEDTLGVGGLDGVGPGGRGLTAKRQVDDGASGAALGGDVVDSPVESGKDGGGGALGALEHLDGNQVGLLGNTVS